MLNAAEHEICPAIVGILTFISRINTASENLKAKKKSVCFKHLTFYDKLKFFAQLS